MGDNLGVSKVRRHQMRCGRQGAMDSQGLGELLKTFSLVTDNKHHLMISI